MSKQTSIAVRVLRTAAMIKISIQLPISSDDLYTVVVETPAASQIQWRVRPYYFGVAKIVQMIT